MKVNKTKPTHCNLNADGWTGAVLLTTRYLEAPGRADTLLSDARGAMSADDAARCQNLFYLVLKNLSLIGAGLEKICRNTPPVKTRALLMVAGAELLECGKDVGKRAKVTDYGVCRARELLPAKMRGFVNAVLRRLPEALATLPDSKADPSARLSIKYSHPEWLVRRWINEFGETTVQTLLEWDQRAASTFIRLEPGVEPPPCLEETQWPGFFQYAGHGGWDTVKALLDARKAYAQDPSTRLCVELLAPKPGERILDLCAAPGGKARQILSVTDGKASLVCVDLPGGRCNRLRENLTSSDGTTMATVLEADVFDLNAAFANATLPCLHDAVLLDAPCSNTGVLRRRPDARWRLKEEEIAACASLQSRLLDKAAEFVAPGGRLLYSTCSIERVENENVVSAFLKAHPDFSLRRSMQAYPWVDGHDGAGAFVLERENG